MVQKIVEDEIKNINNRGLKISLYISNLNMYSRGKENDKQICLPSTDEDIRMFFKSINAENEEYIILEYNSPYQIGEYENIYDINAKLKKLNQLGLNEFEIKALIKASDNFQNDFKKIIDSNYILINVTEYIKDWNTGLIDDNPDILGRILFEKRLIPESDYKGTYNIEENLHDYIKFELIYRDLNCNGIWNCVRINNITYLVSILLKIIH